MATDHGPRALSLREEDAGVVRDHEPSYPRRSNSRHTARHEQTTSTSIDRPREQSTRELGTRSRRKSLHSMAAYRPVWRWSGFGQWCAPCMTRRVRDCVTCLPCTPKPTSALLTTFRPVGSFELRKKRTTPHTQRPSSTPHTPPPQTRQNTLCHAPDLKLLEEG